MDKALRYVMEVYRQVRQFNTARVDAAKMVAKKHRVSNQTVMSALTRDTGIRNVAEFDELIEQKNSAIFKSHLVKRYPGNQEDISRFFSAFSDDQNESRRSKIDTLFDDERENLINEIMISIFKEKFTEWGKRTDIPLDVRNQMVEWLRMMRR